MIPWAVRIYEDLKKCVGYIAVGNAEPFTPIGTFFFVAVGEQGAHYSYAVTARHVIDGAISKGYEWVVIRLNSIEGGLSLYRCRADAWIGHDDPSVDLVVHPMGIGAGNDHLLFHMNEVVDQQLMDDFQIRAGHEVFIMGLFRHHHGQRKNIPIVRVGSIAALDEEKVQTKAYLRDALLIECRSIGGLSGSPVFLPIEHSVMLRTKPTPPVRPPGSYLLGIVHGHFDADASGLDWSDTGLTSDGKINTGIAIVTPVGKLVELLGQDDVRGT